MITHTHKQKIELQSNNEQQRNKTNAQLKYSAQNTNVSKLSTKGPPMRQSQSVHYYGVLVIVEWQMISNQKGEHC